ncbi:MAG TPA: hypothetical protein VK716_17715 [Terracidiphilus sp.]|nr:hypothetical protein [Terracidiphilus sp.]
MPRSLLNARRDGKLNGVYLSDFTSGSEQLSLVWHMDKEGRAEEKRGIDSDAEETVRDETPIFNYG